MRLVHILLPAALIFGAYVTVTPVGEAPDEPAHIQYVDHLIRKGSLPDPPSATSPSTYEAYQPPLAYVYAAAVLRAAGVEGLAYPFVSNPDFDFHRPGSRAFLPVDTMGAKKEGQKIRLARLANLLWVLLAVWALVRVAESVDPGGRSVAWAFALAPQFLFISAGVNNGAAVTAFSCLAFLSLVQLVQQEPTGRDSGRYAWSAGLFAGLSLWSKASGLFLAVPMALAAVVLCRRGRFRQVFFLGVPWLLLAGLWLGLNWMRFGTLWPPPPTGFSPRMGESLLRLLTEPRWIGSLAVSFWGKFGWLNTPFPMPFYALFAPASLLSAWGCLLVLRRRASEPAAWLALTGAAANLAMLLAYMVAVDWQPQGRYLFPSLAPLTLLATLGWRDLSARFRPPAVLSQRTPAALASIVFTLAALAGAVQIISAYY